MSGIDIVYLGLVLAAFAGFAVVLAYFAHADARFRAGRDSGPVRPAAEAPAAGDRKLAA